MIKVSIRTNTNHYETIVEETETIAKVLRDNGVDVNAGSLRLDGVALDQEDLGKTFADFDVIDECFLVSIVKANGAYKE